MARALKHPLDVEIEQQEGKLRLRIRSGLSLADLDNVRDVARKLPRDLPRAVEVHLSPEPLRTREVTVLDALCRAIEERGAKVRVIPANPEQERLLASEPAAKPAADATAARPAFLDALALWQRDVIQSFILYLHIMRVTLIQVFWSVIGRGARTRDDFFLSIVRMGRDALPLVMLIGGLIGAILALQAGPFFRQYGQEVLIGQLVAMSMLREIGPLLTAILVAGRSGSSLAAEIGTMQVSEEIDALTVMGAHPIRVLVAPRLLALLCALPCLVIIADLIGIGGGLVACATTLDVSVQSYIEETRKAVRVRDVIGGLAKAAAYAIVIITVAAHQGFATSGGAAGVGKRTTKSVVLSILWIIVVDAFFTYLLNKLDL